jgi:hypothetical protein
MNEQQQCKLRSKQQQHKVKNDTRLRISNNNNTRQGVTQDEDKIVVMEGEK